MVDVVPDVGRTTRATALLCLVVALGACAGQGGSGAPTGSPTAAPTVPTAEDPDLVLLVEHVGGFVPPQTLVGRTPLAAVYADGRLITDGPVPAVHPGPALPNLQVQRLDGPALRDLVERARDAGIGSAHDLGRPPIADAPTTRFTLATGDGTEVLDVYALGGAGLPGGSTLVGVSAEQAEARAELQELVDSLAVPGSPAEAYHPEAVAAIATGWTDPGDGLPPPPAVPWPGPPLPGEPVDPRFDVHCTTARGEAADAVLEAAAEATAATPWAAADGTRWSLVLRPLLPHESGCADLLPR